MRTITLSQRDRPPTASVPEDTTSAICSWGVRQQLQEIVPNGFTWSQSLTCILINILVPNQTHAVVLSPISFWLIFCVCAVVFVPLNEMHLKIQQRCLIYLLAENHSQFTTWRAIVSTLPLRALMDKMTTVQRREMKYISYGHGLNSCHRAVLDD